MKTKEIREKDSNYLKQELADKVKHLFDLRSQAVTEKLEDPSQFLKTRKEIAQIRTILREREIAEQKQAKAEQEQAKQAAAPAAAQA